MLKKLLLGVLLLVVVICGIAATKPDTFSLERSTEIAAPPEKVFAHVNDFHMWDAWSPWAKMDPDMKVTHSGAPSGVGAVYDWTGNSSMGSGRMEIVRATPGSQLDIKLDFLKPIEAHNMAVFTFTPTNGGTNVKWSMSGENNMLSKVMAVFISMDKMVGPDFEKGLAQLKAVSEKP